MPGVGPFNPGGAQLSDILRERALERRMSGQQGGPIGEYGQGGPVPESLLPEEPMPVTEPAPGGPFQDVMRSPDEFEQMLQDAALKGRLLGRQAVTERRQRQGYSVSDTVNEVSNAIARRLSELTQGVLR